MRDLPAKMKRQPGLMALAAFVSGGPKSYNLILKLVMIS
jgi:hypothetical protein